MAINIKNERAVQLAREVAELSGESITGAITTALEQRKRELERSMDLEAKAERVRELARQIRGSWPEGYDPWQALEDLYDENGLPK